MSQPSEARLTTLVVEDEWLVRMEIADAFADAGWKVIEASAGETALAIFASGPEINLLVTDIRLSGAVSGWDVADAFRASNPDGAVIYASATPETPSRRVRGSLFLGKPCKVDELTHAGLVLCGRDR